jgi:hypothetical protein
MYRTLKIGSTVNWMFAVLVVGGYVIYGFRAGLPIAHHFLGANPIGRGSPKSPPWLFFSVVESILLVAFIFLRKVESGKLGHRIVCGFFGVYGLYLLLMSSLAASANPNDDYVQLGVSRLDMVLALYVWCSHICYALFGGDDA